MQTNGVSAVSSLGSSSQASWAQMLALYLQMEELENEIASELAQNPPSWAAIQNNIGRLKSECQQMVGMASSLSGPNSDLTTALNKISTALVNVWLEMNGDDKSGVGTLLNFIQGQMGIVFQDILQGLGTRR